MSFFGNLYYENLTPRAKLVYMNLKDRADKENKCFPSLKRIASDTSLSKRTVQRALDDLVSAGFISKQSRNREFDKGETSNFYFLLK